MADPVAHATPLFESLIASYNASGTVATGLSPFNRSVVIAGHFHYPYDAPTPTSHRLVLSTTDEIAQTILVLRRDLGILLQRSGPIQATLQGATLFANSTFTIWRVPPNTTHIQNPLKYGTGSVRCVWEAVGPDILLSQLHLEITASSAGSVGDGAVGDSIAPPLSGLHMVHAGASSVPFDGSRLYFTPQFPISQLSQPRSELRLCIAASYNIDGDWISNVLFQGGPVTCNVVLVANRFGRNTPNPGPTLKIIDIGQSFGSRGPQNEPPKQQGRLLLLQFNDRLRVVISTGGWSFADFPQPGQSNPIQHSLWIADIPVSHGHMTGGMTGGSRPGQHSPVEWFAHLGSWVRSLSNSRTGRDDLDAILGATRVLDSGSYDFSMYTSPQSQIHLVCSVPGTHSGPRSSWYGLGRLDHLKERVISRIPQLISSTPTPGNFFLVVQSPKVGPLGQPNTNDLLASVIRTLPEPIQAIRIYVPSFHDVSQLLAPDSPLRQQCGVDPENRPLLSTGFFLHAVSANPQRTTLMSRVMACVWIPADPSFAGKKAWWVMMGSAGLTRSSWGKLNGSGPDRTEVLNGWELGVSIVRTTSSVDEENNLVGFLLEPPMSQPPFEPFWSQKVNKPFSHGGGGGRR
eukprot:ANDGO_02990.mRNA.1 hypothetical protein